MDDARPIRLRPGLLAGLLLAALAGGGSFGGWATWELVGRAGLAAMAAAGGAALAGFAGGLAITLWRGRRGNQAFALGFLLASPARIVLTLLAAAAVCKLGPWSPKIILLWAAIWYLLFLAAEVIWLNAVLRKRP